MQVMMEKAGCIREKINEGLYACFWMAISVQGEVGFVVEDCGRGIGPVSRDATSVRKGWVLSRGASGPSPAKPLNPGSKSQ